MDYEAQNLLIMEAGVLLNNNLKNLERIKEYEDGKVSPKRASNITQFIDGEMIIQENLRSRRQYVDALKEFTYPMLRINLIRIIKSLDDTSRDLCEIYAYYSNILRESEKNKEE